MFVKPYSDDGQCSPLQVSGLRPYNGTRYRFLLDFAPLRLSLDLFARNLLLLPTHILLLMPTPEEAAYAIKLLTSSKIPLFTCGTTPFDSHASLIDAYACQ